MAAETEGIALLSMYGDDEEEEEHYGGEEGDENLKYSYKKNDYTPQSFSYKSPQTLTSPSPFLPPDEADLKTLRSPFPQRTPTPQPLASRSQLSSPFNLTSPSPSPAPVPPPSDGQRPRRSALAIVDYAQDEAAMSPDTEMEIENFGRVVLGAELHVSEWNVEGTTPVTSQSLTPSSQEPFPPSDSHEQSKSEANIAMDIRGTESDLAEVRVSPTVSTDMQIDKPLQSFLPPAVTTKCSEELQEKINKFLTYKKAGKSFNADLRNRKDYRNPNFLQHAVSYQDIDEIGTCFSKEVFDPHGYDKCDYYDEMG
ncbi:hypothetical protein KSP39_PZI005479 [Platanthera zijinensis]|uniref:SAP30-binding protein n=1 Tax=Platanthera zijinensis TaxID=2320716 RepID=A0AAP0BSF4_9ASPA